MVYTLANIIQVLVYNQMFGNNYIANTYICFLNATWVIMSVLESYICYMVHV